MHAPQTCGCWLGRVQRGPGHAQAGPHWLQKANLRTFIAWLFSFLLARKASACCLMPRYSSYSSATNCGFAVLFLTRQLSTTACKLSLTYLKSRLALNAGPSTGAAVEASEIAILRTTFLLLHCFQARNHGDGRNSALPPARCSLGSIIFALSMCSTYDQEPHWKSVSSLTPCITAPMTGDSPQAVQAGQRQAARHQHLHTERLSATHVHPIPAGVGPV